MASYSAYEGVDQGTGTLKEVLIKEDVSDLISNLFPLDTPLQQVLERVAMNNVFMEFPVDTFSTIFRSSTQVGNATAANPGVLTSSGILAKPEGYTFTTSTPSYPARLRGVAEIQGRQFAVTDTLRALDQYAIDDRYNYEALKVTQNVVNDFEHSFWWSKGSTVNATDLDSDAGATEIYNARQTQGLMYWILKTGLERSKSGAFGALGKGTEANSFVDGNGNEYGDLAAGTGNEAMNIGAMTWAYDANGAALDQSMFKEQLMGKWYTMTGRQAGAMGFASPRVKNLFSQFALSINGQINERTIEAASKRVVDTVDWYETDYGVVSINMSRYLALPGVTFTVANTVSTTVAAEECLIFIKPEYYKIGVVRGVTFSPLAKTGDFETALIRGEQALLCRNPQAGVGLVNCIP